ncbi:MAG: lamin tail domain-containing protein [Planctomycetales bacterium]|nr:lamin tail domain-containing protein [Planctomycetales bacterium]
MNRLNEKRYFARRRNSHRNQFERLESRELLAADVIISEFMAVNDGVVEDGNREASDWIELHNRGDQAIDLTGWYLTDDSLNLTKYQIRDRVVQPGEHFILFASAPSDGEGGTLGDFVDRQGNPHTNFELSKDGELLALVEPDGQTIKDAFAPEYPKQLKGVSYGRGADSNDVGYFLAPTPGESNSDIATGVVADTKFDVDRGFYDNPFDVQIRSATPGAAIIYTTDGSSPMLGHGRMVRAADDATAPTATVHIDTTTTLRAIAVKAGHISSNIDTHTYIFLNDVIRQPASRDDLPSSWNGLAQASIRADYEMDPDIVDDPAYAEDLLKGLREIPTMSIVLDPEDMFGQEKGIYINSGQRGIEWEHPTSVEIIEPDGTSFQTDSGIRIHGYSWRFHANSPKHSFRLEFRDEYGPAKLEYPLFPDAPVDRFDSIVLRAQGGRAWAGLQNPHEAQYQRDTYARDLSRELGRVDGHATHVHLYINGLYWGLYNPVERPDAQMGAEYFGGSADDYDALNRRTSTVEVIDGDIGRYRDMQRIASQALRDGFTTDEQYEELKRYIAIDEFIDFMIVNQYVTNRDGVTAFEGNNQRAIGSRVGDAQFRFFVWDMEYSMWSATDNNNVDQNQPPLAGSNDPSNGVWSLYKALRQHPEFRVRYGDRVQQHFFHDGPLTPENAAATWMERANNIENAVVAESARWGDAKRARPYTRDVEWKREQTRLLEEYFPQRSDVLVGHLQEAQLYPTTPPPTFAVNGETQYGGKVEVGNSISLNIGAFSSEKLIIKNDATVSALVPESGDLGDDWIRPDFVQGAAGETWTTGTNGVGYARSGTLVSKVKLDTRPASFRNNASVYVRIPFDIADQAEISAMTQLKLRMLVDDGFVAYLNGTQIASLNAPESPTWNSESTASNRPDLDGAIEYDILDFANLLVVGENVLAIHGMNDSPTSRDLLVHATLTTNATEPDEIWFTTDGSDPRLVGGQPNSPQNGGTAQRYSAEIAIDSTTRITARTLTPNGDWSALTEPRFFVDAPVQISEINYNPAAPTAEERNAIADVNNDDFEFIEITNPSDQTINLVGLSFTDGIEFTFGDSRLSAGERAVVVKNQAAFRLRYGTDVRILGQYSGSLSNSGERLVLADPDQSAISPIQIVFDDNSLWPAAADGYGSTLEWIETFSSDNQLDKHYAWKASTLRNGTPGAANSPKSAIVISEVLSNGGTNVADAVELHNVSSRPVDVSGWWLSDSATDLFKYRIPAQTTIQPGGFWTADESGFNPTPNSPADNHFALSGTNGDDVWLVTRDEDGQVSQFIDHVSFGPSRIGESFIRVDNSERLFPASSPTLGSDNSGPRVPGLLVSEIYYAPESDSELRDFEFIELHNTADSAISLADVRVRGGADADFDIGEIAANTTAILVGFDSTQVANADRLAAFIDHFGAGNEINIIGQFTGRLSNDYDRITVERRLNSNAPFTIEDDVVYDSYTPWPTVTETQSLQRSGVDQFGRLASSWTAGNASPGTADFSELLLGDLTGDSIVDAADIDRLCQNLQTGDAMFDLNRDGLVSLADHDFLVTQILGATYGDANLDGIFNSTDFVLVFQRGEYEDSTAGNSGWAEGDWNCDGDFTTFDFVTAFRTGNYVAAARSRLSDIIFALESTTSGVAKIKKDR